MLRSNRPNVPNASVWCANARNRRVRRYRTHAAIGLALLLAAIGPLISSGCAPRGSSAADASSERTSDRDSKAVPAVRRAVVGAPAPPLDGLALVFGELPPDWRALRGKPIVLEFGAPWCAVCALVHQRMNEWTQQWASYGVEVIGVVAETPDEARQYVQRFKIQYPVAVDVKKSTFRAYGISAVPTVLLIDHRGVIVDSTTGYFSQRLAHMEHELTAMVGQLKEPAQGR